MLTIHLYLSWPLSPSKEMFFNLTTHSTHFIYGYMASDIWLRTILIVREETCCRHIGYSFRLAAKVLLYASSHRPDSTYYGLCYTSRGALAGTRNSSMGPPHEGLIRRPITPWVNALTTELHIAPSPSRAHRNLQTAVPFKTRTNLPKETCLFSLFVIMELELKIGFNVDIQNKML